MKKELATKYDHKSVEEGKYKNWLDHHYFEAGETTKKPKFIKTVWGVGYQIEK